MKRRISPPTIIGVTIPKKIVDFTTDAPFMSLRIIASTSETGFLVNTVEEAAEKTSYLLKHPEEAKDMGEKGREHVLKNFLITRHLKDYLRLFINLSNQNPSC